MSSVYEKFVFALAGDKTKRTRKDLLLTGALGLTGEAGEVADLVKKFLYHDWKPQDPAEFAARLKEEMGDVMWYMQLLAIYLDTTLDDIIDGNIEKLTARYHDRVPQGEAI